MLYYVTSAYNTRPTVEFSSCWLQHMQSHRVENVQVWSCRCLSWRLILFLRWAYDKVTVVGICCQVCECVNAFYMIGVLRRPCRSTRSTIQRIWECHRGRLRWGGQRCWSYEQAFLLELAALHGALLLRNGALPYGQRIYC